MSITRRSFQTGALALAVLGSLPAGAGEATHGPVSVLAAKARPNLPNRPTAAYMMLLNEGTADDRLVSAKSDAFGTIELHRSVKHGDVMHMEPVASIVVPADGTALLEPGGLHLMLFDAVKPHKVGDSFMMTLTFEKAGDVEVEVQVDKITGGHDHSGHDHSGHGDHSDHSGHKHKHTN